MLIGVDIGGTKVAAGIVSPAGQVVARVQHPTPALQGPEAVLTTVVTLVAALRQSSYDITAVGVGSAGQIDSARGIVVDANDNLPGFRGLALRERLQAALHLPVVIDNDVNTAAFAEAQRGAGRGIRYFLLVMVGTGIGGALMADGQVYRGATSIAGEIGHIPIVLSGGRLCPCGRHGCIEAYASGRAISSAYSRQTQSDPLSVAAITERARAGETMARRVLSRAGHALGMVLGGLLNILNPDAIVLGGGVLQAEELFLTPLQRGMRRQALPMMLAASTLRRMELEHDAVLIGAALLASQEYGVEM
jgi:glucokinase